MKLHGCTQHYIMCLLAESTVHDFDKDNQEVTLGVRTLTVSVLILTYITHLVHLKPQTDRQRWCLMLSRKTKGKSFT